MRRTKTALAPVVTLLSPSSSASRKAQQQLLKVCGMNEVVLDSPADTLDDAFSSSIGLFSYRWGSVATVCPSSGTVIHLLSMDRGHQTPDDENDMTDKIVSNKNLIPFSLLGITDTSERDSSPAVQIGDFREVFSSLIQAQSFSLKMRNTMGVGPMHTKLLAGISNGGLPLLSIPDPEDHLRGPPERKGLNNQNLVLKEIVVPYFEYATYVDGSTLLSSLSAANLQRANVGVYHWTGSPTCIRPLPTAACDRILPPLSLVFHCEDTNDVEKASQQHDGVRTAKIGYGGNRHGQLMLQHVDLPGLDVRFCQDQNVPSTFSEAQESLLAGSLDELQSTNILLGEGESPKDDAKINSADCWVEVRANLKRPSGFLPRSGSNATAKQRIAKPVDLPFE